MKLLETKIIIGLGVWLMVLPFTGFPNNWKSWLTVLTGVVVVYISALVFKSMRVHEKTAHPEVKTETFTETV